MSSWPLIPLPKLVHLCNQAFLSTLHGRNWVFFLFLPFPPKENRLMDSKIFYNLINGLTFQTYHLNSFRESAPFLLHRSRGKRGEKCIFIQFFYIINFLDLFVQAAIEIGSRVAQSSFSLGYWVRRVWPLVAILG